MYSQYSVFWESGPSHSRVTELFVRYTSSSDRSFVSGNIFFNACFIEVDILSSTLSENYPLPIMFFAETLTKIGQPICNENGSTVKYLSWIEHSICVEFVFMQCL